MITRIAIVGAGTAGWLAANHLGFELRGSKEIEITVVESADVPSIGVGEGTVPYIKKSLEKFGISEVDLLVKCDATFKQGIKFVDWLNPESHGSGNYYYHPFSAPYPGGFDVTPYWLAGRYGSAFHHLTEQAILCDSGCSPKRISSSPYQGEVEYAYHFDAAKFATLLASNAVDKYNIKRLVKTIVGATLDDDGYIDYLYDASGESLKFDFYVDCSGFSSLLIDGALQVPFISVSSQLLTDSALAMQVPISEQEKIPPYTIATAHKNGWVWDIALQQRRGVGFVYSSAHLSDDEAAAEFSKYLNVDFNKVSPRKIPMKVGYRDQFWKKNCVAIGLSQGFVEPLEATSILVTDYSAEYLARSFPRTRAEIPLLEVRFNRVITYIWERTIDFIKLHYCLSDRNDSDFWRNNRDLNSISTTLAERLQFWQNNPPKKSDFFSRFDLFDAENYLYILYGMKFSTRPPSLTDFEIEASKNQLHLLEQKAKRLQKDLLEHREWLDKLKAAMAAASH